MMMMMMMFVWLFPMLSFEILHTKLVPSRPELILSLMPTFDHCIKLPTSLNSTPHHLSSQAFTT